MKIVRRISFGIGLLSVLVLMFYHFMINNIVFEINGNNFSVLQYGMSYIEEGYSARLFGLNIDKYVKTISDIKEDKIGNYNIDYKLSFLGYSSKISRKVKIIDSIAPEIKLNGNEKVELFVGNNYEEGGGYSNDNYDGDLTESIKVESNVNTEKPGTYQVVYTIEDSSQNKNSVTRNVIVKKKPEVKKVIVATPTVENNLPITNQVDGDAIATYIKNNNYNVSIGYCNLVTGQEYYYQPNTVYYGASLIKTVDALYLYDNNMVDDNIRPYVKKAISISDNPSHQYLVNYIGRENLKNYGINLGAYNTLSGSDNYGNTTVRDQMVYLKKLYNMIQSNEELKSFFINNTSNYLKINDLTTMHKYGYTGQYFHDVGIVFADNPYIVIILTKHGKNHYPQVIRNLADLIYKYHINAL